MGSVPVLLLFELASAAAEEEEEDDDGAVVLAFSCSSRAFMAPATMARRIAPPVLLSVSRKKVVKVSSECT